MTERTRRWTDLIVGDRMAVDQEFADRIAQSQFTRQQWGLIMTAVEFHVENPGDDERARLVADTSKVEHIMPELDNVQAAGPMGTAAGPSSGGPLSGLLDSVRGLFGGGGADQERLDAATRLAQDYAEELQSHLEKRGKWKRVRDAAQD